MQELATTHHESIKINNTTQFLVIAALQMITLQAIALKIATLIAKPGYLKKRAISSNIKATSPIAKLSPIQ
ncbi:11391_t:CDS:2 [Dentiscutata heterogama]|uniref:11391_t:CDS:1 n=1 Tax=Dentiscutata heterogama TaxID=1316150 RepID=A0ACA9JZW6_9GLOM|nr:11391_t:CDS:2 [Dentiscutata heterogama]